jgi:hypothetical protein
MRLCRAAEGQIGEQIGSDVRHVETDATTPTTTRIRQLLVAAGEQLQSTFADLTVAEKPGRACARPGLRTRACGG